MAFLGFGRERPRGGNPNSITAAGFRVTHEDAGQVRRLIQPWQARAFSYYDQLGEINYASEFYARMLSPLRLYPAKLDDSGDWVETDDAPAVAALERIQDPGGGREDLLSSYGRLMFIAGEGYLLCSRDPDTDLEQWEMLSTDELRIQSGVYLRQRAPSLQAEDLQEASDDDFEPLDAKTAVAYRLWKRHPRYSMMATSTMAGILELCEELLLLNRAVRSRARSRLATAGILAISEDFSYAPLEPVPDEDANSDPFLADLTRAMMTAIQNEGAASASVPIVLRGSTEAIEKGIRHIQIVDPMQLYPETGLRYELIKRMAIGLDMPPEILLGLMDANHWTGWMIDEQTWKHHGQPLGNGLVNNLTGAYFRPQLRADGVKDWTRYRIAYDASAIINHPDRTKDAKDLYDKVAIGKKALREAAGFDEEDAPTEEERAERLGVLTHDSSLAWYGEPAPRGGFVETKPGVVVQGQPGDGTPTEGGGSEVEPGPPADEEPLPESVVGSARAELERAARLARILGATDLALLRAREVAGNRIRGLAKRDPAILAAIDGVPARDVAATLGRERVLALGTTETDLFGGASSLLADALRVWDIGGGEATIAVIVEQIERHAARTLYEATPSPLPPQFGSYVAGVLGA